MQRELGRLIGALGTGNISLPPLGGPTPAHATVLGHLQHCLPFSVVDRYDAQDTAPLAPPAGPWEPMRALGVLCPDDGSLMSEVWVPHQEMMEENPGPGWTQALFSTTPQYIPAFRIPTYYRVPLFSAPGQEHWVGFLNFSRSWDADPSKDHRASYLFRCCDRNPCLDGGERLALRQRGFRASEFRRHIREVHQIVLDMNRGIGYLAASRRCKMCGTIVAGETSAWECPHFVTCHDAWVMHMIGVKWWDDTIPMSVPGSGHNAPCSE